MSKVIMGFQAHWGVWNSYSSCSKLQSDGRNEIYKLNWPRKHHYLPKCIHATGDIRFQKTAFFSSFFFFINSTSPHTKASRYSKCTQNWSFGISGVPFDSDTRRRLFEENWEMVVHASMEGAMFNLRGLGNGSARTHGTMKLRRLEGLSEM